MPDPDDDEPDSDLDDPDRTPVVDKPGAATERIGTDLVQRALMDAIEAVE